jgi:polysaccharide biosynthesis transport protein
MARVDLPKLIQPYLQRLWLIVLLGLMGGVAAGVWAYRLPDTYTSRSTLHVAKQASRVLTIEGMAQQGGNDDLVMLNTIVQSISNSIILRRVVHSNRLTLDQRFLMLGETNITEDEAVAMLHRMIQVRLRPKTLLVDIAATSTNARLSAMVANAVAKEYIGDRGEGVMKLTTSGSGTLIEEVKRLEAKLRSSEQRMLAFRERNRITSIDGERQSLEQLSAKLKTDLVAVRDELEALRVNSQLITEAQGRTQDLLSISLIATAPPVVAAGQQIAQQDLILGAYTNRYRSTHPKFIAAHQRMADLEQAQRQAIAGAVLSVDKRLPVLLASENSLKQELAKMEARLLDLNRLTAEYSALDREVATDTALQQSVLKRIKELELTKQVDNVPITVTEIAPVPTKPSGPRRMRLIAGGAFFGMFMAFGLIYTLQTTDSSLRSVDEAEERLQVPVLGAVSVDPGSKDKALPRIVMVDEAHGLAAEGFRSLRTTSTLIARAETIKVRLVTSALPSEGKSFCALNYAAALAQLGQSVVLVDMDLRRPTVGLRLGLDDETPGVSSYLLGQKSVAEIVQGTRVPNLSVIVAGPRIPNPAEQLAGSHTGELFAELTARFDVVVVDTAPVNSVSDTVSLLAYAQVVLLVIKAGKTPERVVRRAISEIHRAGSRINGLVLNQLPKRGGYGYYYYYYSKDGYKAGGVYGAPGKKGK